MKKSRLSMIGAGFAMAIAGLGLAGQTTDQASTKLSETVNQMQDYKSPKAESQRYTVNADNRRSYDPTAVLFHDAGMSPKEYGLRYGNGGSKRSNRLRLSHNAKLKRR